MLGLCGALLGMKILYGKGLFSDECFCELVRSQTLGFFTNALIPCQIASVA